MSEHMLADAGTDSYVEALRKSLPGSALSAFKVENPTTISYRTNHRLSKEQRTDMCRALESAHRSLRKRWDDGWSPEMRFAG